MVNNFFLLLILVTVSCYSQSNFPDSFRTLLDFEFSNAINDTTQFLPDGRYYAKKQDENGSLLLIRTIEYKNKKKHGEALTFRNGLGKLFLANVTNYCRGRKDGYFLNTDNHTFKEEGYYRKNERTGYWEISNLDMHEKLHYKNGLKSGDYRKIDNLSGISVNGRYKMDKKDGLWITEDSTTGEITKEVFKNGRLLSNAN